MTRLSQRLLALYLAALIALAALGAHNQFQVEYQTRLLEQQRDLQAQLTRLRYEAAGVTGALAVRTWALGQGMVAAPEALNTTDVAPRPAPQLVSVSATAHAITDRAATTVEMQTLWH